MVLFKKLLAATCLLSLAVPAASASAGEEVKLLVIRENGVGSAAQGQQYLDQVIEVARDVNGWSAASGRYMRSRTQAEAYVKSDHPHLGILSLSAFLAMRGPHKLQVLGKATVKDAGGRQYHLVSKTAKTLNECKGQKLASDHLGDEKFVENVVAGGAFKLSDFQVVKTRRPLQTIKAVTRGEATCALIDDAQHADLKNVEGGGDLASVWKSSELPPMVVVGFGSADASILKGFKAKLTKVCSSGAGKKACGDAGIKSLDPTSESTYGKVIKAYGG